MKILILALLATTLTLPAFAEEEFSQLSDRQRLLDKLNIAVDDNSCEHYYQGYSNCWSNNELNNFAREVLATAARIGFEKSVKNMPSFTYMGSFHPVCWDSAVVRKYDYDTGLKLVAYNVNLCNLENTLKEVQERIDEVEVEETSEVVD
jgi:hypothetical protein